MKSSLALQKRIVTGYICLSVLIIIYVVWRSTSISFTHDESLSYTLLTGNPLQKYTANNHWLNTIFMYIFSRIFGYSELALRLPNILALVMYLLFIYLILKQFCANAWSFVIAVPFLLMNPFILDFFGIARGYGLGVGFFTGALYYFLVFFHKTQSVKHLALLVLFSVCCIYANYAFLIALFSVHCAIFIAFLKIHQKHWKKLLVFYAIEAVLLIPAILNVLLLSKNNELYAGGDNSVYEDTIKSIFLYSFDNPVYNFATIMLYLLAFLTLIGLFFYKNKALIFTLIAIGMLILIPYVLHKLMDLGYPKDRAALYWMVILGISVLFLGDNILVNLRKNKIVFLPLLVIVALQGVVFANFFYNMNVKYTKIWKYDCDVETALEQIAQKTDHSKKYTLGINWAIEPSINYYIQTKKMNWLNPVTRDGVKGKYDFYLFFPEDFNSLDSTKREKIHYYPKSQMYLSKAVK